MANPTTYLDERYLLRQGHVNIGLGNTGAITVLAREDQARVSTGTGNTGALTVSAAGVVHAVMVAVSVASVAVGDLIQVGIGTGGDANRKLLAFGTYAGANSVNVRIFNTTSSAIAVSAPLYVVASPLASNFVTTGVSITVSAAGATTTDFVIATLGTGGDANAKVRVANARVVAANSVEVELTNTTSSAIAISAPVYVWTFPRATFLNQSGTSVQSL